MNHRIHSGSSGACRRSAARLLAALCLICSWNVQATAPRVAPQMFGEEPKADIVGYQLAPPGSAAATEGELIVKIVNVAFRAAGKKPVVDVLPSRQLAKYALQNNDALALIGRANDLMDYEESQYRVVTFYLGADAHAGKPVLLIFSKEHGYELHLAFTNGLRKILRSGRYLEMLEQHFGKGLVPADYASRLQRLNPGWK